MKKELQIIMCEVPNDRELKLLKDHGIKLYQLVEYSSDKYKVKEISSHICSHTLKEESEASNLKLFNKWEDIKPIVEGYNKVAHTIEPNDSRNNKEYYKQFENQILTLKLNKNGYYEVKNNIFTTKKNCK